MKNKSSYQKKGYRFKPEVDERLNTFHASREPGRAYSAEEISKAIGVSPARVKKIIARALLKVRVELAEETALVDAVLRDVESRTESLPLPSYGYCTDETPV